MWMIFEVKSPSRSGSTGDDSEYSCFTGVLGEESAIIL